MQINVRGDKVTVTPAIKKYIEDKIGKLDKYFENPEEIKASVIIKVKNKEQMYRILLFFQIYLNIYILYHIRLR